MAQTEHTLRKNEKELERQFEGVLEVCNNIASSMKSIIQLLYKTFTESLTNLSKGEDYDFTKLNYEVSEMLESFLVSKDITPVYNLSTTIKTSMSKIIMLLEDVENLEYEILTPLYNKCLKLNRLRPEQFEGKKFELLDFSDKSGMENPLTINLNNIDTNNTGSSYNSGNFSSAKKFDDLDSFKRKSLTTSDYQGSYEDNRPYKLNRNIQNLVKVIKHHDLNNYSFCIKRDLGLAKSLSDGFYDLTKHLKIMVEKIHSNVPLNCLERMHDGVFQLEQILKETSEVEVKIMDERVVSNGLEEISEAERHHEVSFEGCEFKSFEKKEKNSQEYHHQQKNKKNVKNSENDFVNLRLKNLLNEKFKKMESNYFMQIIKERISELEGELDSKFDQNFENKKLENYEKIKKIYEKIKLHFSELTTLKKCDQGLERIIDEVDECDEDLNEILKKLDLLETLNKFKLQKLEGMEEISEQEEDPKLNKTVKELTRKVTQLLESLHFSEKGKMKGGFMKHIKKRHMKNKRSLDLTSKRLDISDDFGVPKKLLYNLIKSTSVMCCSLAAICSCKREEKMMSKIKDNISSLLTSSFDRYRRVNKEFKNSGGVDTVDKTLTICLKYSEEELKDQELLSNRIKSTLNAFNN